MGRKAAGLDADDIPVAHTPPGGYGDEFPPPTLAGCTEPLVDGAPDLRGTWRVVSATRGGAPGCRKGTRYWGTPSASNSVVTGSSTAAAGP